MRDTKAFGSHTVLITAGLLTFLALIVLAVPTSVQDLALVMAAMGATGAILFLWAQWPGHTTASLAARIRAQSGQNDGFIGISEAACRLCGASIAAILVRDPLTGNLQSICPWAVTSQTGLQSVDCSISLSRSDAPELHGALDSGKHRMLDVRAVRKAVGDVIGPEIRRLWAFPVSCARKADGLLLLGSNGGRLTSESDGALDHVADISAWALRLHSVEASHAQQLRNVSVVCDIFSKIGPRTSAEEVGRAVAEAAASALESELVSLFTVDSQAGAIVCESTDGVSELLQAAFLELYGETVRNPEVRDPLVQPDLAAADCDDRDAHQVLLDQGVASLLACPVRSEAGVNGALVVFYAQPTQLPDERLTAIQTIAAVASPILSYAEAIEQSGHLLDDLAGANRELSRQATVDGLTGLVNHRTLQQTLAQLCRRSGSRTRGAFSVIMVDVDHFKVYNDAYGHREGDAALRQIAWLISSDLRQRDLPARYGGEEFAILLRGVSKETALGIAERVRRRVAEHRFHKGSLTVSAGVAEWPWDGSTPSEIIERADRALYHAKVTGRNRTVVWGSSGCPADADGSNDRSERRRMILVVDQAADQTVEIIRQGLCSDSYLVEFLPSVEHAVEMLRTLSFDLALVSMDAEASGAFSSLELLTSMHPEMPVVAMVHNPAVECGREAVRHGVSDVLPKPFIAAELPMVIERNIERSRLERRRLTQTSTTIMLQAIEALVAAIDAKDHFTAGHSRRVASLALAISDDLDLSNDDRYALELTAKIHDIGKLGLPDSALNKKTSLADHEWEAMRQHPALGSKIVGSIDELAYVSAIIRHHHERLDGSGYPDGLRGDAIPYLSRIIAVADSYEAMTSERAYRARLSPGEAMKELKAQAGTHYSPEIVEILERKLIESGELEDTFQQKAA